MMKILLFITLVGVMGTAGFFAGRHFTTVEDAPVLAAVTSENEPLYKLPLGRFFAQIVKPKHFLNIRFNLDVYIVGAANFERMNGGLSRNQMREEVLRHLSNMVETTMWVEESKKAEINETEFGLAIARKLYHTYPMVRTAQVSELLAIRNTRDQITSMNE